MRALPRSMSGLCWPARSILRIASSLLSLRCGPLPVERSVFRRSAGKVGGVAFIQCVDDSVVITGDARREIAYGAPGAFCDEKGEQRQTPSTGAPSSNEQDLAVINAYHVESLSMIGKQYLLHLTQKSPPHRELVIGVLPDSLWYYKSAQNGR